MFVYYDKNGVIKEIINDDAIRQGNANVNTVYFFIESDPEVIETDANGKYYKAPYFNTGRYSYYLYDENHQELSDAQDQSFDISTVKLEVPYDKKKELKYFKYFTRYQMFKFVLPEELLNQNGTVAVKFRMTVTPGDNPQIETVGVLVFNIETTSGETIISSDTAITIAEWNYLVANMLTPEDVYTKTDADATFQEKLESGVNIKTINNESILGEGNIEIQGGGGSGDVSTYVMELDPEGMPSQEDLQYVFENKPDMIKIKLVSEGVDILDINLYKVLQSNMAIEPDPNEDEDEGMMEFVQYITASQEDGEISYMFIYYDEDEQMYMMEGEDYHLDEFITQSDLNSALSSKQDLLNFDEQPTQHSTNPVYSGGVFDALQDIEEVAAGTCKTLVLSYQTTMPTLEADFGNNTYFDEDGHEIETYSELQSLIGGRELGNPYLNSDNDVVNSWINDPNIGQVLAYFVEVLGDYTYKIYTLFSGFRTGDILLITETTVPDRWFDFQSPGWINFYKLETTKVDLTHMVTDNTTQTISGAKTFSNDTYFTGNAHLNTTAYLSECYCYGSLLSAGQNDLGSSSYAWQDLYLSGTYYHTNYSVSWDNGVLLKNSSNATMFYIGSDKSVWFYNKLVPSGTPDIGDSTHSAGSIYVGAIKNGASTYLEFAGGANVANANIRPNNDGVRNLGQSNFKWNDLYLSGSIKGMATLTQAQYDALVAGGTVDADTFYFIEE